MVFLEIFNSLREYDCFFFQISSKKAKKGSFFVFLNKTGHKSAKKESQTVLYFESPKSMRQIFGVFNVFLMKSSKKKQNFS